MREVHKFALAPDHQNNISASILAKVALVGFDPKLSMPCIWLEADWANEPSVVRTFFIIGTGWSITPDLSHVASLIDPQGYVWHVYERQQ